jgi:hypothetical protein
LFPVVGITKALAASQLSGYSSNMNWQSEHPGWCNSTTKQTFLGIDEGKCTIIFIHAILIMKI